MRNLFFSTLVPLCLINAVRIEAAPVLWTLSNVTVSDGSSISGYFVFDADIPSPSAGLTDYQIAVSGGNVLPAFVYEPASPVSQLLVYSYTATSGPQEVFNPFRRTSSLGVAYELLYLEPDAFLTDAGGTVPLDLTKSSAQLSNGEVSYSTSLLTSGSFVGTPESGVPEPGSFSMVVVLGLAATACFSARWRGVPNR